MVELINNENKIPVDEWDTEANPIQDTDRIFRNIKGEIILPLAELYSDNSEESKALDYFVMSPKKSYNTDEVRDHVCRYLNYFEKFYDTDKELLMMMFRIKLSMDFLQSYKKENFVDDHCSSDYEDNTYEPETVFSVFLMPASDFGFFEPKCNCCNNKSNCNNDT